MDKIEHTTVPTNGITIHVASLGSGPEILFLHGYPELWYSWRHQIAALSALGYRCIAPDLRGFGDSDAPAPVSEYNVLRVVGDLVGLLDKLHISQVFLVGHDWGAYVAWHFGLFRPDRIKALVNTSVPFFPRNPDMSFVQMFRSSYGNDFYIVRYQKIGEPEAEYVQIDTAKLFRIILTDRNPDPRAFLPKDIGKQPDPKTLPSWLSNEDVNYYVNKFKQTGIIGGINYYRSWDLT